MHPAHHYPTGPAYNLLNDSHLAICVFPAPPLAIFFPKAAKTYQQP